MSVASTVELGVSCSIHLAHAAFADLGGDGSRSRRWCQVVTAARREPLLPADQAILIEVVNTIMRP